MRLLPALLSRTAALVVVAVVIAVLGSAVPASAAPAAPHPALGQGDTVRLAPVEYGCTVGFNAADARGRSVAITAGHCDPQVTSAHPVYPRPAYPGYLPGAVGQLTRSVFRQLCAPGTPHASCPILDYAAIALPGPARHTPVAAPGQVRSRVCKLGRITGLTCGHIVAVTPTEVVAEVVGFPGDSGSALLDPQSRTIAVLSRVLDDGTQRPDLASAVTAWGKGLAGQALIVFTRADVILKDLAAAG